MSDQDNARRIAEKLDYDQRKALRRLGRGQTVNGSMLADPVISTLYTTVHYPTLPQHYDVVDYCDWEARMYAVRPQLTPFGRLVLDALEATK